jgi:hypothetical protein
MFKAKGIFYFFYFLIFLSVVLALIEIGHSKRLNKLVEKQSGSVEAISNELNNYKDDERLRLNSILKYSNFQMNDLVIFDDCGIGKRITEVVSKLNSNVLVFRYTELNCNSCVSSELNLIKDIFGIDNSKVIVITTYSNILDMIYFKRDNNIKFKLYNILSQSVLNALDDLDRPYCFVIDLKGQIMLPFVPTKENAGLSNTYYKYVNELIKAN